MFKDAMVNNRLKRIKDNVSIKMVTDFLCIPVDYNYMCVCPFHADKDASLRIYRDGHFHCYGCGITGDVIEFYKQYYKISCNQAIDKLENDFKLSNIDIEKPSYIPRLDFPKQRKESRHFKNDKVVAYVKNCREHISLTNYFSLRGITQKTLKTFNVGYDRDRKAVVIPYNKELTYYQSRSVVDKKFYKLPTYMAGAEPLFNIDILKTSSIVFVVESPICAMSITQCGAKAIPLCGVKNTKKFLTYLAIHKYKGVLVLCMDNDTAGENATNELENGIVGKDNTKLQGLKDLHIRYIVRNIADECKDPNELLIKDETRLLKNLQLAIRYINRNREYIYV